MRKILQLRLLMVNLYGLTFPATGHGLSGLQLFCLVLINSSLLVSCSTIMSSASEEMAGNLARAIKNQDDPETVRAGAPAYLIMIDGMIEGDPDNEKLLSQGAGLYSAYAGIFVQETTRRTNLSHKAWDYARRAMCLRFPDHCEVHAQPYEVFEQFLALVKEDDARLLYLYGTVWAGYIQSNSKDWNNVADVPKVTATLRHVQKLDDSHDNGGVHLYLGILGSLVPPSLGSLVPPSLGGKPDEAKSHFERAIEISEGKNLMAKVYYAEKYARLVFNRALHDEILQNVLNARPRQPGMTLMNILAQERAKALLESADEYF